MGVFVVVEFDHEAVSDVWITRTTTLHGGRCKPGIWFLGVGREGRLASTFSGSGHAGAEESMWGEWKRPGGYGGRNRQCWKWNEVDSVRGTFVLGSAAGDDGFSVGERHGTRRQRLSAE